MLVVTGKPGRLLTSGIVRPIPERSGEFELEIETDESNAAEQRFRGILRDGKLVLVDEMASEEQPARITFRTVAGGDRLLVLFERRVGTERYVRLAELSYTRQGSDFGKRGGDEVECVVTGGLGTIPVTYNGKTYYVCCTGCRDYFQEDPEQALAEYRERRRTEESR